MTVFLGVPFICTLTFQHQIKGLYSTPLRKDCRALHKIHWSIAKDHPIADQWETGFFF